MVTTVDLSNYSGGTVSYLNSDFSSAVSVRDISGNLLENGDIERDEVNATVLKNRYHTVEGKNELHKLSFDLHTFISSLWLLHTYTPLLHKDKCTARS